MVDFDSLPDNCSPSTIGEALLFDGLIQCFVMGLRDNGNVSVLYHPLKEEKETISVYRLVEEEDGLGGYEWELHCIGYGQNEVHCSTDLKEIGKIIASRITENRLAKIRG